MRRVLKWLLGSRTAAVWLTLCLTANAIAFGLIWLLSGRPADMQGSDFTLDLGFATKYDHSSQKPVPLVQIFQRAGKYSFFVNVPLYIDGVPSLVVSGIHPGDCRIPYDDPGYVKITPITPTDPHVLGSVSRVEFTQEATHHYTGPGYIVYDQLGQSIPLECTTGVAPHHDTFADRRIAVANITDPASSDAAGYGHYFIDYNVDFSDLRSKDGLRLWGGWPPATEGYHGTEKQRVADGSTIRQVLAGEPVNALWRDDDAAARRDLLLIVSGAIFGIGGSFFVE